MLKVKEYLKEKLAQLKNIFWNNFKGISVFSILGLLVLILINHFFIDWNAFIHHGMRELRIEQGSFNETLLVNAKLILFVFSFIFIAYNLVAIILKINKFYTKIISYFTLAIALYLSNLLLYIAFGTKAPYKEFVFYHWDIILFIFVLISLLTFFITRCKFKNKITASITVFIVISLTLLPFIPKTSFAFRAHPAVFDGGDSYVIVWATTGKALSWVDATINGEEYTFYDLDNAIARVDDVYHRINIPKLDKYNQEVESFSYTINSKRVRWRSAAFYKYGKELSSKIYNFSIVPMDNDSITIGLFADVHDLYEEAELVADFMGECDIYLILGDMQTATFTQHKALKNVDFAGNISKGEKLVYPTRGNHESRGTHNHLWTKYMITPSGEQYYTFDYNDLSMIVLDTGDDHDDSAPINGEISFWKEQTQAQVEWLASLEFNSPKWLFSASHINFINRQTNNINMFTQPLENLGVQMLLHGHNHRVGPNSLTLPNEQNNFPFPAYIAGGQLKDNTLVGSKVVLYDEGVNVTQYDNNNQIRFDYFIPLN